MTINLRFYTFENFRIINTYDEISPIDVFESMAVSITFSWRSINVSTELRIDCGYTSETSRSDCVSKDGSVE